MIEERLKRGLGLVIKSLIKSIFGKVTYAEEEGRGPEGAGTVAVESLRESG